MRPPAIWIPSTGAPRRMLDAQALEVRRPGIDPDVGGGPVEHAVGAPAGAREVEQQLQQDRPAGARAHLARPRRHERAREPVGEELPERRRALLRADEGPPALQLPLAEAALVAARQQRQQALEEERRLVRRDAEARGGLEHEAGDEREVLERLRQVRRRVSSSLRPSPWASSTRSAPTRWPSTPIRCIVSGTWR